MLVPTPALLGPPSPGPHEPVPQPSLSGAVRASSGQPFWLLVWRLRGLLRRGRPARASGAGDPASLFWGVRHEAAGRWARVCLCLLRWGARGVGRGEHLHTFFPLPLDSPHLTCPAPSHDLVGTCPLTGTRVSWTATKHDGLRLTWEVCSSHRQLLSTFLPGMLLAVSVGCHGVPP